MRHRIKGVVLGAAALLVFPIAGATGSSTCWNYKPTEREFRKLINTARGLTGAGRLRIDPELSKAARVQTRKMIKQNRLFHSKRLGKKVTNWTMLGENVGYGGSVASLHKAFMNSSGHRANILKPGYRNVGVGVKRINGRMWVTVIFQAREDPGTTFNMPKCKQ